MSVFCQHIDNFQNFIKLIDYMVIIIQYFEINKMENWFLFA
jgi:hypothetical protein